MSETHNEMSVEQWLAIRKEAGLKIDPETAEVCWDYAYTIDPSGVTPDLPEELQQIGREYFARSPDRDVWVSFRDLPKATRDALWAKHSSKLAFPAGLAPDTDVVDDDETVTEAIAELAKMGLIVDSGRRRNGRIVWVAAEHAAKSRVQ